MAKIELGAIIAERVLRSAKMEREVTVRVGLPQKTANEDFITPYQIIGVGDEGVRFAAGLDSVQSLQLVFPMISADIEHGLKDYQFRWAERDDAGFSHACVDGIKD